MSARTIQLILEAQDKASPDIQRVRGGVQGVGTDLRDMQAMALRAAGALGITFGAREVLSFLFTTNRETEKLQAQLRTFDGQRAAAVFRDIEQFASSTPFQIGELTEAYVKLRGVGINPTEEMLTAFGDTTAAMSKDIVQWAEAVTDAATGGGFERLKEFGIKASAEGNKVRLMFRGQSLSVAKDAQSIVAALQHIGETQFAGAMAEQMDTIDGVVSNSVDSFESLARLVGESGVSDFVKEHIRGMTAFTSSLVENRDEVVYWTKVTVESVELVIDIVLFIPKQIKRGVEEVGVYLAVLWNGLLWHLDNIGAAINWVFEQLDRLPGVNIDFRFAGVPVVEWKHMMAGAVDELGDSVQRRSNDVNDLFRSFLDVSAAGDRELQGLLRKDGPTGVGLGGADLQAVLDAKIAVAETVADALKATSGGPVDLFAGIQAAPKNLLRPFTLDLKDYLPKEREKFSLKKGDIEDTYFQNTLALLPLAAEADAYEANVARMISANDALADSITSTLQYGLVDAASALGPALLGIGDGWAGLNQVVAGILGDMMINAGTTIVATSSAFEVFKEKLLTLSPGGAIGVGLALIAAGAAMKSAVGSFLANPTGGGGGGGFAGGSTLSLRDYGDISRSKGNQGRVEIHLPSGPMLYDPNDYSQREAFKRMFRQLAGSRELVFVEG